MTANAVRTTQAEGKLIATWIEKHCLQRNGKPAQLTSAQKQTIARVYDLGGGPDDSEPLIERELRTWLVLCHLCGVRAAPQRPMPASLSGLSLFTVWGAAGPTLKDVLVCRSSVITCPELGTRYEAAA